MAKKFYDLSVSMGFMTPDWMGHGFSVDRHLERLHRHEVPIAPDLSRQVSIAFNIGHKGTHFDGPTHHVEGALTADKIPLEKFYGTGVILDLRYMKKWQVVTPEDLEKATPKVEEGDIGVFLVAKRLRLRRVARFTDDLDVLALPEHESKLVAR